MARIKRDVAELRRRAINSLVLAVEVFNRPYDTGRAEAVLILLHHSFEMLLKAAIKNRTGTVFDKESKYSYSFDKCLEVAQGRLGMISADERTTLLCEDSEERTVRGAARARG
jgi:hypothetical protein